MTNILQNPKGISHANDHMGSTMMQLNQQQEAADPNGTGSQFAAGGSLFAYKKSLNREARKRELMKITRENQVILKRL